MICFRGLAHHDVSFSETAAGGYLLFEKILNEIRLSAMTNGENKGSSREVKVLTNMSMAITKKDNILGYTAPKTRKWCRLHFQAYWAKGDRRGNSSDLSRIKNQWEIIQEITTRNSVRTSDGAQALDIRTGHLAIETCNDGYVKILWLTGSLFSSGE